MVTIVNCNFEGEGGWVGGGDRMGNSQIGGGVPLL